MKIAIACGGTGGHMFPGVAVARVLEREGHAVVLWLSGRGTERLSRDVWGGDIEVVPSSGFSTRPSLRWGLVAWGLGRAWRDCRRRLAASRPDVMLAMGSYASVGPALAAHTLGIPLVLHEANVVPGRAVSFLSRWATVTALAFQETAVQLPGRRTEVTGFPPREGLLGTAVLEKPAPAGFNVLVMGGSQGAQALNRICPDVLALLRRRGMDVGVIHLAGAAEEHGVREAYRALDVPARVLAFCDAMGEAYRAADVAVTRGGAATCAELALMGVPAALVPLPSARRDHQTANAKMLVAATGGAVSVVAQKDLTPLVLADALGAMLQSADGLAELRRKMARAAVPDAAARLAALAIREAKQEGVR